MKTRVSRMWILVVLLLVAATVAPVSVLDARAGEPRMPSAGSEAVARLPLQYGYNGWPNETAFFPNAPYICTDMIHLSFWFRAQFWVGLTLILLFAFNEQFIRV